ncbi:membrane protein [Actinotalea ferrariae CF5-4]|uniref:Membrane protein n=1 Tax=Actinotalea ferrariae CF5-4 TaxID=948458 RepID=A0A021VSA3_9CELL|nr:DUF6480 family protein [Actinotalea ferrariae]EYR62910.1 membrane protein [Actinotalea ferrariae CF5-4]
MTHSPNPADPDPAQTPGLEPGGGVAPGDTPPGESSATPGTTQHQPELPSERTNKIVYGLVIATTVVGALFFLGYALGLVG